MNGQIAACFTITDVIREIKRWKGKQLVRFNEIVVRQNHPTRRAALIGRHLDLFERVTRFSRLTIRNQMSEFLDRCAYLGWLMSFQRSK